MNRDAMMVPLTYLIQFAGPIDSKTAEAIASALLDAGLHLEQYGIDYTHCTSKGDKTLAPDISKLNSEQIIKTLEWCIQAPDCENCEYKYEHKHQIDVCSIRSDALALIKELTDENERLKEDNHILATEFKDTIIADTVRKMHSLIKERCIKDGIYPAFVRKTIDQIAKEMLEG